MILIYLIFKAKKNKQVKVEGPGGRLQCDSASRRDRSSRGTEDWVRQTACLPSRNPHHSRQPSVCAAAPISTLQLIALNTDHSTQLLFPGSPRRAACAKLTCLSPLLPMFGTGRGRGTSRRSIIMQNYCMHAHLYTFVIRYRISS